MSIHIRYSNSNPCPVCGTGSKGCSRTESGLQLCRCEPADPRQWRKTGEDDNGFAHFAAAEEPRPIPPMGKPSKPQPPTNWQAEAERYARTLAGLPRCREELAKRLGLPVGALDSIPLLGIRNQIPGTYAEFTIPEMDAKGTIIGLATRTETKGQKAEKKAVLGSKRGLLLTPNALEHSGTAFVVEGATDFLAMTEAGLLAIARPSNSGGGKHLAELFAEWVGEVFILGENDIKEDGHWPGRDGAVNLAKQLTAKLGRPVKWAMPPEEVKDVREWLNAEARGETPWPQRGEELSAYFAANTTEECPPDDPESSSMPSRTGRRIILGPDEHRVNDEAAEALADEAELFQRGGQLVSVVKQLEDPPADARVRRPHGAAMIRPLTQPNLRDRLSHCVQFISRKQTNDGIVERPEHPPAWCTSAVFDRGLWPVRKLEAILSHPAFLSTGSLLESTGFDPASGLYLSPESSLRVNVPERPTHADVARAVETLEDAIADFPFQTPAHKAAWYAALLTPLAWFAFEGPAPLFLIDANVRAAGKGLLADVIAIIVMGRRFSTMAYTSDREELRKKITSLAVEGERAVLLDNLAGSVGNDVFDNALTSSFWKDRILGRNKNFDGPLHLTWYGTGNNVQLGADTSRRTCHIRMESPDERPELKANFRQKELRTYVRINRGKFLSAALTILRGWHEAGRPTHNLASWGSFEEWSAVVREAVVFAGLPDPGLTREELQKTADRDAESMGIILDGIERLDPNSYGLTAAELIQRCQSDPAENADLLGAMEELCFGKLDGRRLGGRFKHFQRRNFGGRRLDKAGEDRTKANRWAVYPVGPVALPMDSGPAFPASPAFESPVAGEAGNAGSIPGQVFHAPAVRPAWEQFETFFPIQERAGWKWPQVVEWLNSKHAAGLAPSPPYYDVPKELRELACEHLETDASKPKAGGR